MSFRNHLKHATYESLQTLKLSEINDYSSQYGKILSTLLSKEIITISGIEKVLKEKILNQAKTDHEVVKDSENITDYYPENINSKCFAYALEEGLFQLRESFAEKGYTNQSYIARFGSENYLEDLRKKILDPTFSKKESPL
jgi:hypothetical protein